MKRKILWLIVSCLMVAALVLASCAPAVTEEEEKKVEPIRRAEVVKKEEVTPGPEVPKYGGVFTTAIPRASTSLDPARVSTSRSYPLVLTHDNLAIGDWAKGPAGTNECGFSLGASVPEYRMGCLAKSWEIPDPETIIFHIRQGVHFALNPESEASRLVGGREMTAHDVAFCIERKWSPECYLGVSRPGWFRSATATDKWTVVVKAEEVKQKTVLMVRYYLLTYIQDVYPPEVIEKYGEMHDWKNSVGTGPFMLTDFVSGSSYTFVRNPNHWMKDPVGPGKGNQLPYLDGVLWLDMRDKSTRIAALRTGRIDFLGSWAETDVLCEDRDGILKTNPEIKSSGYVKRALTLYMRTDKPELPFYDIRVRKALHMGVDFNAIKDEYLLGGGDILYYPVSKSYSSYTPLEELPESTQELFSYNPEKAKELLAEAGYPDGFKTTIICTADMVDMLSIVAHNWEGVGIELELIVKESGVHDSILAAQSHKEMVGRMVSMIGCETWNFTDPGYYGNLSIVDDPYINERLTKKFAFENMTNIALQDQMDREWALHVLDQAYSVQLPCPYLYNLWQPWVKNYHGEVALGKGRINKWHMFIWLDQDLKEQMTGRR